MKRTEAEEPIGLLIGAVRRRIKQAIGSRVQPYRLTSQQFWVLVAIHEHPGYSLGELAAHIRMDVPTASRVVATLMKRKLVQTRDDANDRRRACLHLRPSGAALGSELLDLAAGVRAAAVQGLSRAEQTALRISLRKIIDNMERFQRAGAAAVAASARQRAERRAVGE